MNKIRIFTLGLTLAMGASIGFAQDAVDHGAMLNHTMSDFSPLTPREPGQGAFAAIAEIVSLLSANPTTDWSTVDIGALRAHLVDMDVLVTTAQVIAEDIPGGLRMKIAIAAETGGAIERMVPAHAAILAIETGWKSTSEVSENAVSWSVTSPHAAAQIRALGFFGLMATGAHHQEHHLAIAKGRTMH